MTRKPEEVVDDCVAVDLVEGAVHVRDGGGSSFWSLLESGLPLGLWLPGC